MVDTQHFCLRWNNYQSSITSAFENLRDDEDFVDVTLACDGKSLKAHRVVLSACSPYFRELLKSTPCKHPVIVLQDVAWTDLHALVEFIYHGEVNVHQRSLSSFLKTAEVLRVSGLTQQGEARDQLAQVQSMVRSQQLPQQHQARQLHSTPIPNHYPNFADKIVEDSHFQSPTSPPHGATVNQLLKQAALHYTRGRRISSDPEGEHKRARAAEHILGNNNNNNNELNMTHTLPPQTQPADFSPSGMKNNNNALNLNVNASIKNEIEGNGISSTDRENSPCSPSPTILHPRCMDTSDSNATPKNEPMDLLCGGANNQDDNSDDSATEHGSIHDNGGAGSTGVQNSLPQGPHSGGSSGDRDHDDRDSAISPYLTATESKLFASATAAGFNFSMAALTDPSALGGLNASMQGDSLAGTSQDDAEAGITECERITQTTLSGGVDCKICGKRLRNRITLRRHVKDLHYAQTEEFWCKICNRCYRTKNSLVVHICNYHQKKIRMKNCPNLE